MTAPAAPDILDTQSIRALVEQMLARAHPLLREALFAAAVPHLVGVDLLRALRNKDDDRDGRLLERIAKFSFVDRPAGAAESSYYEIAHVVRHVLQVLWIEADAGAYRTAHARALAYFETNEQPDSFEQAYKTVYHQLFVKPDVGAANLREFVSDYLSERRLAEAARLLSIAAEATDYLARIDPNAATVIQDVVDYGQAQLALRRNDTQTALDGLIALREKGHALGNLHPYVLRALGAVLEATGDYIGAIDNLREAIRLLRTQPESGVEQARAMLQLGAAHVNLAVAARGFRDPQVRSSNSFRDAAREFALLPISLPLLIYLRRFLGQRIWTPKTLRLVRSQDWILARLFNLGYRWYEQARERLLHFGAAADLVRVDEQTADLFVAVGDSERAEPILRRLLEQTAIPLSDYRRARLQVLLGQATLRNGNLETATYFLEMALPVVQAYEDTYTEARAAGLLAEAQFRAGDMDKGLLLSEQALRLYHSRDDIVGATEIAERLSTVQQSEHLTPAQRSRAGTSTKLLSRREYPVRFQHPALVVFRRLSFLLLAAFIFFMPVFTIQIDFGNVMLGQIGIMPAPPLQASLRPNPLDVTPSFTTTLATSFDAGLALRTELQLIGAYVLIYLALGVAVVARTGLKRVQAQSRATVIRLDLKEIAVGRGDFRRALPWSESKAFYTADVTLLNELMIDNSRFAVASTDRQFYVDANTAWYGALRDRLPRYLHATTQVRDLGYRILKSKLGAWYVASAAFLLAVGLIGEFAPDILRFRPFGWSYSIADLYPFSFLGLALPPLIWAVVWPLRNQAYVRASQRMVWIVFAAALLISAAYLYANTGGREPWIWPRSAIRQQIGFIYPVLVVLVMQTGVLAHAWGRGLYGPGRQAIVRRPLARALVTLAAITSMAWTGWHGARHGLAYHLAVLASARRDTGAATVMAGDGSHGTEMLQEGLQLYDRSLHWVPRNVAAISGRSAILLQLGEYKRALEGFDRTVQLAPDNASYRLWRGVTYHAQQQLDLALLDYEWILARDPAHVNALTGRGWVYFQRAYRLSTILGQVSDEPARDSLRTLSRQYYHEALSSFEAALAIQPAVDLWLAVGYVHYGLEDYHAAERAWRNAQVGEQRADVLLALATVHWRLATLGGFACDQASASLAARESGAAQIESAIAEIDHALELDPAADFTHRTRAQLEFLLRNCPGYDFGEQVAAAIAGYGDALARAPDNDLYLQFRARLGWTLARHLFLNEQDDAAAKAAFDVALADIERAVEIDPAGPANRQPHDLSNTQWRDFIAPYWAQFYEQRAAVAFEAADYGAALADAQQWAQLAPAEAGAALTTGLYALALEDAELASEWYEAGVRRAAASGDARAVRAALDDLQELVENRPEIALAAAEIDALLQGVLENLAG